jgi:NAD(P)-dependent dehydrogenase (short-subunit alcohol dehydrogenase family)
VSPLSPSASDGDRRTVARPTLKGKVAVVTGATSGLGRWVAEGLAAQRATTVVVGRTEPRTVAVAAEIASRTGNPDVYPLPVSDLALRSEVARVSNVLVERYPRVHLLVNNAGAYYHRRGVTGEGLERTVALNVLAPFLLTARLLPRIVESAPARIVMVASEAHRGHDVPFQDLQSDHGYRGFRAYGRSKLEVILLAREFAHRLHDLPVTVNAVHPGFVATRFGRNNGGAVGFGIGLASKLFGRNVRRAAEDIVSVATDPSLDKVTGEYFAHRTVRPGSPQSRDMVAALHLYEACTLLAKPFV